MDEIRGALKSLEEERSKVLAQLDSIDRAIASLRDVLRGPRQRGTSRRRETTSVYTTVVGLIRDSSHDWNANELIDELGRRGTPLTVKDPPNAVRSALARAQQTGDIERTEPGRYGPPMTANAKAVVAAADASQAAARASAIETVARAFEGEDDDGEADEEDRESFDAWEFETEEDDPRTPDERVFDEYVAGDEPPEPTVATG
jgi:hypothetical protein